jgi:UDP-glucose 4-epimerase
MTRDPEGRRPWGSLHGAMPRLGSDRPFGTLVVGAGLIGGSVAAALLAAGHEVTVLTRSPPSPGVAARLAGARVVVGDAADAEPTAAAFEGAGTVVYCAGAAGPAEAERDPVAAERVTIRPLLGVLSAAERRPGTRLIFVSSGGTVYGDAGTAPVSEARPLRPMSAYARLKAEAEGHLAGARAHTGVTTTALRCANVYGPGQAPWRSQGVVATLLAAAASDGAVVPLFGDGRAVRDHILIDDVARAVVSLLALPSLPPAVNVGTGIGTTLSQLVALVEDVTGRHLAVRWHASRPTDLGHVVLDVALLRQLVGFAPTPLRAGLTALWAARGAGDGDVDAAADRSLA